MTPRRPATRRAIASPLALVPLDAAPTVPTTDGAPPDPARACGWLESSLDLRDGLQVQEHDSPDALHAWLPWHWWLRWALDEPAPSVR